MMFGSQAGKLTFDFVFVMFFFLCLVRYGTLILLCFSFCVWCIHVCYQTVIGVIIAFVYSWNLTLVLIAISPLMGIGSVLQMKILANSTQSQSGAFQRATNLAIEVISGMSTVASFGWTDKVCILLNVQNSSKQSR